MGGSHNIFWKGLVIWPEQIEGCAAARETVAIFGGKLKNADDVHRTRGLFWHMGCQVFKAR
jgi:hypothetical protein